ncbi:MAG: DNA polymerase III subunit alpha [Trueperaceae bacterium]|nr:DNA polymerase III subunit alpha [Trueperaceae bacterium]
MGGENDRLSALLNVHSYYSFGAGTASPTTLVERASALGYQYLALTDDLNVTGVVELFKAAEEHKIRALIGATVPVSIGNEAYPFVLIATSREGYATICELITVALARAERAALLSELLAHNRDVILLSGPRDGVVANLLARRRITELQDLLKRVEEAFHGRFYLQLFHDRYRWDERRARVIRNLAKHLGLPAVSAPEVRYATPDDYRLYDALTCARLGISVQQPHANRPQNDCQALPSPAEVLDRLPFPDAALNTGWVGERARFELVSADQNGHKFITPPKSRLPRGEAPEDWLEERCRKALPKFYSGDALVKAGERFETELKAIKRYEMADFFLVTAEITDFCQRRGIMAAGRGSAAASIVCYLLGITKTEPLANDLLFERFMHTGMKSMPDIDIDIASDRRQDVLDWVEERFGADTHAMVCNKITYHLPMAIQDLGRALGLPPELRDRLTKALGRDFRGLRPMHAAHAAVAFAEVLGDAPVAFAFLKLLSGMEPEHARHLAPHCGGVVLGRYPLSHYSPTERSSGGSKLLQLDKDDAEELGIFKLDLLGLRMLAALERAREDVLRLDGVWLDLGNLPDDPRVWDLMAEGSTMGLFQVESPSQQHTSRVMRSRNLHDLAHQVALIRPGPIQSGTVHPYLKRRQGLEKVTYWHPKLEPILEKSYGVLLFQEDVLRIAVSFAGMGWDEADRFRKRVSGWGDFEDIEPHREKFIARAMRHSDATRAQAERVFDAIKGFQGFGFAESHAWAFAIHAYASGWLRINYPAEYLTAVFNDAPGMWSHSTKRQEARTWGVPVLPLDINASGATRFYCERTRLDGKVVKAMRPPLATAAGITGATAVQVLHERLQRGPYANTDDAHRRLPLSQEQFEALVRAGAFDSLQERRDALFRVGALSHTHASGGNELFTAAPGTPSLATLELEKQFTWDHETMSFSPLEIHVLDFMRGQLRELGCVSLATLRRERRHATVRTAGLVVSRQKPPTAKGFAFYVLEDGPVRAQLIIPPDLWESHRVMVRDAAILVADAVVEDTGYQVTLKASTLASLPSPISVRGYHFA